MFVKGQAARRHQTTTEVVVAALRAEMRRGVIEQEIAACQTYPDTDVAVLSTDQLAEVWRDLD